MLVTIFIIITAAHDNIKYFMALKTLSMSITISINSTNTAYNIPMIMVDRITEIKLKMTTSTKISFIKEHLCAPNIRNDENILEYCRKINLIPIKVILIMSKAKNETIMINISLTGTVNAIVNIALY